MVPCDGTCQRSTHAAARWRMDMQGVQPQSLSLEHDSGPQDMTSTGITPVASICIVFRVSSSQKGSVCGRGMLAWTPVPAADM